MSEPARRAPRDDIALAPELDVALVDGETVATSGEPWMRLEVDAASLANRWVEMVYDASLVHDVARPVLRCFSGQAYEDAILPGPVLGRGIWLGKIPAATTKLCLSPANREGPFRFRIRSLRPISFVEKLSRARRPRQTWLGLGYGAIGWEKLSDRMFRRALMATPMEDYPVWRDARRRPWEPKGIDRLPAETRDSIHIRVLASAPNSLLTDLRTQTWPSWSIVSATPGDGVIASAATARMRDIVADLKPEDLVAVHRAHESWRPEAWAELGTAASREVATDVFYGDEEICGTSVVPRLKPDWSPILSQSLDLIGRAWAVRVRYLLKALGDLTIERISEQTLSPGTDEKVSHIPRILLSTPLYLTAKGRPSRPVFSKSSPAATLIVPTRDRAALLRACVASLWDADAPFELIVVDNGSREEETRLLFEEIARHPNARILSQPGEFNYSALCNAAASQARSECLVFLNNDTEAVSKNWLSLLVGWTKLPSIGAVGGKLLYPDGRLQHAGVLLGIDGHANHYERLLPADAPGYFERLQAPHEVSAVTGACLAVARDKFATVGGFDADHLPIEFSDIDLCLRLAERGFGSVLEPDAVLIHHEAATRKKQIDQEERYASQVAYFKKRWLKRLRSDPYFHPALSLSWHGPALD
jgi:GT2 family glycosyltransferase